MKNLCFIALFLILLAFPSEVRADISPPIFPPGSNPQPGAEITQVRMAAETVVVEVQKDTAPQSLGRAHVTADFTMHNTGTADESMAVRFPITADDGFGRFPEIENVVIAVNGKQVPYRRANYPDIRFMAQDVPWAEFDVTFPAGQDVSIRVAYDLKGSGYYPTSSFFYILITGRGWKGTIGSADVILRLPYQAGPQSVIVGGEIGSDTTTRGGAFQGNEVRWHFDDFEPGENNTDGADTMAFALVSPSAWQAVLSARASVEQHPNDGEAWGLLAKAYKEAILLPKGYREDAGGQELYRLSVEAYEKCLSLKPDDAQWHAGFAELLANRAIWASSMSDPAPETFRALEEIHTALELAPNDAVVQEIAQNITYMIPEGMTQNGESYDFPWLTQTPPTAPPESTSIPVEEPTTTSLPLPAVTSTPQAEPRQATPTQPIPTAAPKQPSPICGSAALLPLLVMFWFAWKQR